MEPELENMLQQADAETSQRGIAGHGDTVDTAADNNRIKLRPVEAVDDFSTRLLGWHECAYATPMRELDVALAQL